MTPAVPTVPDVVESALEAQAIVERCLAAGFARLDPSARSSLESLASCFASSPLGGRVAQSAAAISGGHVTEDALIGLAAARESLAGACHDALFREANEAAVWAAPPVGEASAAKEWGSPAAALTSGLRQWLVEVALAGVGQLEVSTVAPFVAAVGEMQAQPELARVAALVTGFVDELMENVPTAQLSPLPLRRWTDLWARCLLLSIGREAPVASETVSGELDILGAYMNQHDHVASLVAYGALGSRIVRTTVSAWKVDAVTGVEVWSLFDAACPELVTAIGEAKSLTVKDMTLLETGDLLWDGAAKVGKGSDPIGRATELLQPGAETSIPMARPCDRHPVQLALPVLCSGLADLPRANEWIPTELAAAAKKIESGVGLLRFDGGQWLVQPLFGVGTVKKKTREVYGFGEAIAAARKIKKSASTISVLKERASKLLRA